MGRESRRTPALKTFGLLFALLFLAGSLCAQQDSDLRQILGRLESLEQANHELANEVRALRAELASIKERPADAPPDTEEQLQVQAEQLKEQAQAKVEAGQRFPLRLKGMLLMNTFLNSKQNGGQEHPAFAANPGDGNGGISFRQSIVGLDFQGPKTVAEGRIHGSLLMDFYGGSGQALDQVLRVRTATMQIDWRSQSLKVGLDKPVFAPREPDSVARPRLRRTRRSGQSLDVDSPDSL